MASYGHVIAGYMSLQTEFFYAAFFFSGGGGRRLTNWRSFLLLISLVEERLST